MTFSPFTLKSSNDPPSAFMILHLMVRKKERDRKKEVAKLKEQTGLSNCFPTFSFTYKSPVCFILFISKFLSSVSSSSSAASDFVSSLCSFSIVICQSISDLDLGCLYNGVQLKELDISFQFSFYKQTLLHSLGLGLHFH